MGCCSRFCGPLLRTPEEVDDSISHYPFTLAGTAVVFVVSTLMLITTIGAIEICQSVGTCSKSTWNEDFWGINNPNPPWCEEPDAGRFVGQTYNAYSNFWFGYVGVWILAMALTDILRNREDNDIPKRNNILNFPFVSVSFAFGLLFTAFGSFAYHSFDTTISVLFDYMGTNVLLCNLIGFGLIQFINVEIKQPLYGCLLVFVCVFVTAGGILLAVGRADINQFEVPIYCIAVAILLNIIGLTTRMNSCCQKSRLNLHWGEQIGWEMRAPHFAIAAILSLIIGIICQESIVDVPCDPSSDFQFHAMWHVACGSAAGLYYMYMRGEHVYYKSDKDEEVLARLRFFDDRNCCCFDSKFPFLYPGSSIHTDYNTTNASANDRLNLL